MGKKQKLLIVYRQVICMCFQVYGLSNIDLLRCVCVYVCCAALSPSFYFCLHSSSFVCSTSPPFRLRQVSSIRPRTLVCLFVCLCGCLSLSVSASFVLAASLWKKLRKREQPGKYKQTQQQRLQSSSSLIRLYKFPTRQNNFW